MAWREQGRETDWYWDDERSHEGAVSKAHIGGYGAGAWLDAKSNGEV